MLRAAARTLRAQALCSTLAEVDAMLVVKRKAGQSIALGSDIRITILSIENRIVRLGIDAAHDVPVRRLDHSADVADAAWPTADTELP